MMTHLEEWGASGVISRAAGKIRADRFRAMCLALSDVEECDHFDRAAFRTPIRIFATLDDQTSEAKVLLPLDIQQILIDSHPEVFERLKGAWDARGWTRVDLRAVDDATCAEVIGEAHAFTKPRPPTKPAKLVRRGSRARHSATRLASRTALPTMKL